MAPENKVLKKYQLHDRMWRLMWLLRSLGMSMLDYELPTETVSHERVIALGSEYLPRLVKGPDRGFPQMLDCLYYFLHRVKNAMDRELLAIPLDHKTLELDFPLYESNFLDNEEFVRMFNQAIPLDVNSFHSDLPRDDLFNILSHMLENSSNEDWMIEYVKGLQNDIPDLMIRFGFSLSDMNLIHAHMFNNNDLGSKQLIIIKPLLEVYRRNRILSEIRHEEILAQFNLGE